MAAHWYCLIGQQQYGPFNSEQIQQLVQQGQLLPEHFVRTETDSQWTAAGELPGLFPSPQIEPSFHPRLTGSSPGRKKRVAGSRHAAAPLPPPAYVVPQAQGVTPPVATPIATPVSAVPVATPLVTAIPVVVTPDPRSSPRRQPIP